VITEQNRLSRFFSQFILTDASFTNMEGRTAGFVHKTDAIDFMKRILDYNLPPGTRIALFKVVLSNDLMAGEYGTVYNEVVARREIEFLEEISMEE
ncbi:unnamed protein product, partial [marine sediment metagenome]